MYKLVYMNYTTQSKIQKWGNGYGVLLPKRILEESVFGGAGSVTVRFTSQGVTLTPAPKPQATQKKYTLAAMVKGMKDEVNAGQHEVVDFGADVGREVW